MCVCTRTHTQKKMSPHLRSVNCFTDRRKSTVAFSHCRTASDEADDKKQGSNCDDDYCRDQGVHVFEKVIVVVKCNEDIGSDVTQDTCGRLGEESIARRHFNIS